MPLPIFVLGLSVFCMNTTEVMVSGLLPALSQQFHVSIPVVGYLVSAYAVGMAVGGPLLTIGLRRISRRHALIGLFAVFLVGQTIAALAPTYAALFAARIVTAVAAGAFFGTAAAVCVDLVGSRSRGRALSVVFGGLMVAAVVGLPMATVIDQFLGWRASFWTVDALSALCLVAVVVLVRPGSTPAGEDLRAELAAFRNGRLWVAYATNALSVGAVFAVFSYLSPIFTQLAGFPVDIVPALFAVYGAATVVGNVVVGRLADRHNVAVLLSGQIALTVILALLAMFAHQKVLALALVLGLGLVGLPLSSARSARIMSVSNNRPLVSTVATAMVNVGIIIGPWLGGLGIRAAGYTAPAWIGAALALGGVLTIVPAGIEMRFAARSYDGSDLDRRCSAETSCS